MVQSLHIGLEGPFTNLPFGICAIYFDLKVYKQKFVLSFWSVTTPNLRLPPGDRTILLFFFEGLSDVKMRDLSHSIILNWLIGYFFINGLNPRISSVKKNHSPLHKNPTNPRWFISCDLLHLLDVTQQQPFEISKAWRPTTSTWDRSQWWTGGHCWNHGKEANRS